MKVCELGPGYSKVMMELDKKHLNPFGGIHGGAYASVIDTAAYWAAYCDMEEDAGYTSMDLCVNNLAMLKGGCILAEGRRIKSGRNIYLCEAEVKDGNGKLIAHGTSINGSCRQAVHPAGPGGRERQAASCKIFGIG